MPQLTKQPAGDEESDGTDGLPGLVSSSDGSYGDDATNPTMKRVAVAAAGAHKPVDVSSEEDDSDDADDSEDEEESEDECSDVEVPNLKCAACGKMSQEVLTSVG